jgi:predicted transcriptional regulator
MTTLAIRKKLTTYLQVADDKEVKKMYALLKDEMVIEKRITIEQYNKEIDEAEAEYERGDFISHEEMLKKMKKW